MTKLELIRLIGNVIIELDELRSDYPNETKVRDRLDNLRDKISNYQRRFVRSVIAENTQQFQNLAVSLSEVNTELHRTIDDVNKIAATLETLVKFVGVIQKIMELIP